MREFLGKCKRGIDRIIEAVRKALRWFWDKVGRDATAQALRQGTTIASQMLLVWLFGGRFDPDMA
jgi:hypothetical protein